MSVLLYSTTITTTKGFDFNPETLVVKANWLYVGLGDDDYDTAGQPKKITFVEGGGGLLDFTNLGILSVSGDSILFMSNATFTFEVTANTFVGPYDVFPEMNLEAQYEDWFFQAKHYGLCMGIACDPLYTNTYYAKWNYVDKGSVLNLFEYSNPLPITVGIKNLRSTAGSFVLNNKNYTVPTVKGDIIKVTVLNTTYGTIGNYSSEFRDVAGVQKAEVELKPLSDTFSSGTQTIIDYYNDADLGWKTGPVKEGGTLAGSTFGGDQPGAEYHNPDPLNNPMFTFNLGLVLAPESYEWVQYNNLTKARIKIQDLIPFLPPTPTYGPTTKGAPKRVVGIQTINSYIRWNFSVDVVFVADLELSAELSDLILSDPILFKGDWVWDTSVTGDYDVEEPIFFPSFPDPWGGLLGGITSFLLSIFMLIIIPLIVLKVLRIIPKRKIKKIVRE